MRPTTTLFLLSSVDGKISTGDAGDFDFDRDLPNVPGVCEGLYQYYEEEKNTDLWSFTTGRVLAKVGWNYEVVNECLSEVSFLVYDNKWLSETGIGNLSASLKHVVIATHNVRHESLFMSLPNVETIVLPGKLSGAFEHVYEKYGCKAITIQSGGRMNTQLFRDKLIDRLNIFYAPVIVGGKATPSIADGDAIRHLADLAVLELIEAKVLKNNYLQLKYNVI